VGVEYRQPFTAVTGVAQGPGNALSDGSGVLVVGQDFGPLGFSTSGNFGGEVVFAGYGIVAPDLGYDDYAGVDVRGKVVLAMRYEPGEDDPDSPFDGKRPSRYSDLRDKAMRARNAGAAALIFVAPARGDDDQDKVPPLVSGGPTSRAGLPVLQVTRKVADRWLRRAGKTLGEMQAQIDAKTHPASIPLPGLSVSGTADVTQTEAQAWNVVAQLPGAGELADQVVVLGAHYDHLGHGGDGSMRPDSTDIHNGADDNASGTAAMVCAMAALAQNPPAGESRRSILGVAFTAEEIGLGGSQRYVEAPLVPLDHTAAMVNLDMVGRVRDNQIHALGTDSAPEWPALVTAAAVAEGLQVQTGGDGYGPSDHSSFYAAGIPVVHLFSGAHEQYHTPDDDAALLNVPGGSQVTRMVVDLASALATRPAPPTWTRSVAGPPSRGDSRGYGAYLGTVPSFDQPRDASGGVKLADVKAGGPAERAGVRAGDVVIGLSGAEVETLPDLSFLLQDHKPGETVEVVVLRSGQQLSFKATLGKRGEGTAAASATNPGTHVDRYEVGADAPLPGDWVPTAGKAVPTLLEPGEKHLADLRQLTFGGENAEAYWSPDGRSLIFQRTPGPGTCDQQYLMDLTTGGVTRLSSGDGRTTCGYYDYSGQDRFVYATTEGGGDACPPVPDRSQGYVWPLFETYELVWHTPGQDPVPFLPHAGYDAEATGCMKDGRLVFTSVRDGDLELYLVNPDGTGLERLTDAPGYDGGAFFDPKCTGITWRAGRPTGADLVDYKKKLANNLVEPDALEIYWMDLKTRKVEQLTDNGAANFGPYPLPDGTGVVYASNAGSAGGPEFDLFLVKRATKRSPATEPERITTARSFDGFPMFSPDGKWLVFGSNRATPEGKRDTNLFVARWVP
ncbi:MAG: M28 family peptidase, partial [Myxococcota bacterium]